MMPANRLFKFLDENEIKYVTLKHSPAYTAQGVAASAHIPGREMAKTVMVKLDGKMAMAVLPASENVNFSKLKKVAAAEEADLAGESEFRDLFPNCEVGTMPPFGNLYELPVYSDIRLAEDEEIAFSAGSHAEVVRMRYLDYERLAKPEIASFSGV
jgi:Ala-tRNA(Pro) deacylase